MIFLSMVLRHCPATPESAMNSINFHTVMIYRCFANSSNCGVYSGQSPPDVNIPIFIAFDVKL